MGVVTSIRAPADVKAVMRGDDKIVCRGFVLFRDGSAATPPAFAFVVTKKYGGAVQRNRLKRRLREIAKARIAGKDIAGRYVFLARARAARLSFAELTEDCDYALRRFSRAGKREKTPETEK